MAAILALLALLFVSYWQTIEAYPSNGGAYTVANQISAPMPVCSPPAR